MAAPCPRRISPWRPRAHPQRNQHGVKTNLGRDMADPVCRTWALVDRRWSPLTAQAPPIRAHRSCSRLTRPSQSSALYPVTIFSERTSHPGFCFLALPLIAPPSNHVGLSARARRFRRRETRRRAAGAYRRKRPSISARVSLAPYASISIICSKIARPLCLGYPPRR